MRKGYIFRPENWKKKHELKGKIESGVAIPKENVKIPEDIIFLTETKKLNNEILNGMHLFLEDKFSFSLNITETNKTDMTRR